MLVKSLFTIVLLLLLSNTALAKDILITNDTGTQEEGNLLVEVNYYAAVDKSDTAGVRTRESATALESIFSYGVKRTIDFIFTLPYAWTRTEENGAVVQNEKGITDMIAEVKWRFYEAETLSMALKPGISFPTGDADKGLGTDRAGFSLFWITSKQLEPFAFNLNLAYYRNENTAGERKDLWYGSLSAEYKVREDLLFIVNSGMRRPRIKETDTPPAFFLAGINYAATDRFSVNLGIRTGLNEDEADRTYLAGIAARF